MRRACKIWTGLCLITIVILLTQCSPYAGRNLLGFFFDGVPGIDSTETVSLALESVPVDSTDQTIEVPIPVSSVVFMHYPYEERECNSCHDQNSLGNMIEPQPGLCYICHEDLSTRFNYLHGPVASGYCTSCHDPHRSETEKLLRFKGQPLCLHCHKAASVFKNEMHQDLDGMVCTDCHNPHGGEDKYIFQ